MKFYCRSSLLDKVEGQDYELLIGVDIDHGRRGLLKQNNWGSGWIYEADDSFRSWCAIAYGFEPAIITEYEYQRLDNEGCVFMSKERTEEFRKDVASQLLLIDKMRFEKYR